ncbi:metal ABC transporter substrate-binding protein [Immundisolibacter cernigliae]|uniref:Zinc ABC transporter substrate-binding protein n=1 Tax=Immundisolibacter cernigliae TaxID=1810504 RepID=A0A1B1YX93_9GAMM|nr:zinc ABC transporter substrate-binding protein [Immundisolibacter cernigliae]ANX05307.1 zinc ABC transporter substrate-binding protein [Immundisolibacter cernigliae]
MKSLFVFVLTAFFLAAPAANAALNVLTCEPEWAALTQELAGDLAQVSSATTALQDPHRIQARPSLLAKARRADLLICTGAELEMGWLPLLQREAGNARIQPGQPGYFEAARFARIIERPTALDRAQGDVHASGNPHLHLDPRNIARVADGLTKRLADLDPVNGARYAQRNTDFQSRWTAAMARWEQQGARLRGAPVVVHHRNLSYLADWLGLQVIGELEPRPGMEPTAGHLAELLETLKATPARMVLRTAYESPKASEWLASRATIPALELPYTVGGSPGAKDLFGLFDDTLSRLQQSAP